MGFGLLIGFIELLQLISTKIIPSLFYTLHKLTIGHNRSSQSVAFTSLVVTASNSGSST
jgi:hypothetical protein